MEFPPVPATSAVRSDVLASTASTAPLPLVADPPVPTMKASTFPGEPPPPKPPLPPSPTPPVPACASAARPSLPTSIFPPSRSPPAVSVGIESESPGPVSDDHTRSRPPLSKVSRCELDRPQPLARAARNAVHTITREQIHCCKRSYPAFQEDLGRFMGGPTTLTTRETVALSWQHCSANGPNLHPRSQWVAKTKSQSRVDLCCSSPNSEARHR